MSLELDALGSGFNRSKLNTNTQKTEDYVNDNLLHRDGVAVGQDNSMKVDLDMNGKRILNVPQPVGPNDLVRAQDLPTFQKEGDKLLIVTAQEAITLTSGQTLVTLTNLTTTQTAFFISGVDSDRGRLEIGADYTVTSPTSITLTESYPSGTRLIALQNEATEDIVSDVQTFDNIAAMKTASLAVGDTALCKRYYAGGESVSGLLFNIVAGATGTDDGGSYHDLANGNQAELIVEGVVKLSQFGAINGGALDSTTFIQSAFNFTKDTDFVLLVDGIYLYTALNLSDATSFCLQGKGSLKTNTGATYPKSSIDFTDCSGLSLEGVVFDGSTQLGDRGLVKFDNCSYSSISNCKFKTLGGFTLLISRSNNIAIEGNDLRGGSVWCEGISFSKITGNSFKDTQIDSLKLTSYAPEPIGTPATHFSDNVIVDSNSFDGSSADFIDAYASARNIIISNNVMKSAAVHGIQIKNIYRDVADYIDGGSSDYLGQGFGITITGNKIENVSQFGILIRTDDFRTPTALTDNEKMKDIVVTGNVIRDCDRGVYISEALNVTVNNNMISECGEYGVHAVAGLGININSNNISSPITSLACIQSAGASTASLQNVSIIGNFLNGGITALVFRGYATTVSGNNVKGHLNTGISALFPLGCTLTGNCVNVPSGGVRATGTKGIVVNEPSYMTTSNNCVQFNDVGYEFNADSSAKSVNGVIVGNTEWDNTTPTIDNILDITNMQVGLNTFTLA